MESLRELGQYRPIIVNKRDKTILAGNHTWEAAKRLGWKTIKIEYVDADEQMARKINLVDNRSNDVATYDDEALAALLQEVEELAGTGFSDDDLAKLLATDADLDPDPTPSLSGDLEYRVVIDCRDEEHQADLISRLEAEGLVCRSLIS